MKKIAVVILGVLCLIVLINTHVNFDDFILDSDNYRTYDVTVKELEKDERYKGIINDIQGDFFTVLKRSSYKETQEVTSKERYCVIIHKPGLNIKFIIFEENFIKCGRRYYTIDETSYKALVKTVHFYILLEKYS